MFVDLVFLKYSLSFDRAVVFDETEGFSVLFSLLCSIDTINSDEEVKSFAERIQSIIGLFFFPSKMIGSYRLSPFKVFFHLIDAFENFPENPFMKKILHFVDPDFIKMMLRAKSNDNFSGFFKYLFK